MSDIMETNPDGSPLTNPDGSPVTEVVTVTWVDVNTTTHVITQLQLLFFSALAFTVLMRTGIYPPELKSVNLDFDWSYRRAGRATLGYFHAVAGVSGAYFTALISEWIGKVYDRFHHSTGPEGRLAQTWPTGAMVLWIAILLGVTMAVNFLS